MTVRRRLTGDSTGLPTPEARAMPGVVTAVARARGEQEGPGQGAAEVENDRSVADSSRADR